MSTRLDFATLSLMDALDLAILIEAEAYERYKMFNAQLGSGAGAGAFFANMAENEAKHGIQLSERRKAMFGEASPRVSIDDLFDVEAPGVHTIRSGMSVRQAFEVGVSAEQKAYDFYDEALKHITEPTVVELFTELRDEETEHVRMLEEAMAKLPASANVAHKPDPDDSPFL